MVTARIFMATVFLFPLPAALCATQVHRLNAHSLNPHATAVSPQNAFKLGLRYLKTAIITNDHKEIDQAIENMISCWTSAALNYNPEAAYALGKLYEMGTLNKLSSLPEFAKIKANPACCKRDLDKALVMYTLAAQYGHYQTFQHLKCESKSIQAMAIKGLSSLGIRFQRGLGTQQDLKKAAACFAEACKNGGKVPAYLDRKNQHRIKNLPAKFANLTVDTTFKIKATPKTVPVPPTTVVTPAQQQNVIMHCPVYLPHLMSWGWMGYVVQGTKI